MLNKTQTPKGEAPGADNTEGLLEREKEGVGSPDFATETRICEAEFAALKAKFAALKHNLYQAPTGADFMANRWGLTRYLANTNEARAFLRQLGGRP